MTSQNVYEMVSAGGMDVHYKFSQVTMRDEQARVVRRERLDQWPKGVPFVMEASSGA